MTDRLKYWERGRLIFGAELGSREKLVLLAISDHLGSNDTAWPSHGRIARRCGLGLRTVVRAMEWLETHEVLLVQRVTGSSNRYQISIDWLKAHQCHPDTSATVAPVSERHTPCATVTHPPVSERHTPCATVTPKGDQEGNQEKEVKKATKPAGKTASKTKRQLKEEAAKAEELRLREEVKAIPKPDGLPDGYAELFDLWIVVRRNPKVWTRHESQTVRFHQKMLKAHQQRKDVMRELGRAHQNSWQGIEVARMDPLPINVSVDPDKPRRPIATREERLAAYRKTLEIS